MTTPDNRFSIPRFQPPTPVIPAGSIETRSMREAKRRQRATERAIGGVGAFNALQQGRQQVASPYGKQDPNVVKEKQKGLFGKIGAAFEAYADLVDPFASIAIANTYMDAIPGSQHLNPYQKEFMSPIPVSSIAKISGILPALWNVSKSTSTNRIVQDIMSPEGRQDLVSPFLDNWNAEDARIEETRQVLRDRDAGTISFADAWLKLGDIQQSRPLTSQMMTGMLTDPVGLIPFSPAAKGAKTGLMGLRGLTRGKLSPDVSQIDEATQPISGRQSYLDEGEFDPDLISTPSEALDVIQSPETTRWTFGLERYRAWAANLFSPNSVANIDDPAIKSLAMIRYYMSNTHNAANMAMLWVNKLGNPLTIPQRLLDAAGGRRMSFDLREVGVSRKAGTAESRLFPGVVRPGGARAPLKAERLGSLFADLFAGRTTVDEVARQTALGRKLQTSINRVERQQGLARREALSAILNGDPVRRKGILNFWGVDDAVKREPADGILRKTHIDEFMKNPDVIKRIDDELAGSLPATSDFARVLIETGQSFPSGAGKTVSRFLNEADRVKVFDDTVDPLIKSQELALEPTLIREGVEEPLYPVSDVRTRQTQFAVNNPYNITSSGAIVTRIADLSSGELRFAKQSDEIFFEEYAQFPELFDAPEEIRQYVANYHAALQRLVAHAIKIGAIPETDYIGKTPGEYSQMIWKVIETTKDEVTRREFKDLKFAKPQLFGAGKNMEEMRIRDYVVDSLDLGLRGEEPAIQMHSTFEALYQMIGEKYVMDAGTPWTKALERRMAKSEDVFDAELTNLKNIDPKVKAELKNLLNDSGSMWVTEKANLISGFMRTLGSGFDAGAPLIHGVLMLFTDPRRWAKSVAIANDALLTGEGKAKYYMENLDIVNEMQRNNAISVGDAEFLESLSGGGYLGRGLETLSKGVGPEQAKAASRVFGRGAKGLASRFGNHFDTFLFASRVEMYKALRGSVLEDAAAIATKRARKAGTLNPSGTLGRASDSEEQKALGALAEHINKMFGTLETANTGLKNSTRKTLGAWVTYAPRYRLASYAMMFDFTKRGYRGTLARDRLSNFLTSGLLWYSYTCHMLNQEPKLDPSRGDFMSIKVGGQDLAIGSVWISTARLFGNVMAGTINRAVPLGMEGTYDWEWLDNPLSRFMRSQISPLSGTVLDIVTGKNFVGAPLDENLGSFETVARGVGGHLLPFWLSGFFSHAPIGKGAAFNELTKGDPLGLDRSEDEKTEENWALGAFGAAGAEFGGLRTYPASTHEKTIELANDEINIMIDKGELVVPESQFGVSGNVHWNDLNPIQKGMVRQRNPVLNDMFLKNKEIFAGQRGEELDLYFYNVSSVGNKYKNEIYEAAEKFEQSDPMDANAPAVYRKAIQDAGARVGARYKDLRDGLTEEAITDMEAQLEEKRTDPDADFYDLAFFDYIEQVVAPDFETTDGDYDHRGAAVALGDFLYRWTGSQDGIINGQMHPAYQYIQQRRSYWWPDTMVELKLGQEAMTPYWSVPDNILQSLGMAENITTYDQYKNASPARQREMEVMYPWIPVLNRATTTARKNLRMLNPSLDHFLLRWGYARTAEHPFNIGQPLSNFIKEPVTVDWAPMGA